jgi:hypothetical protein
VLEAAEENLRLVDDQGDVSRTTHVVSRATYFVRHAVRSGYVDLAKVLDPI